MVADERPDFGPVRSAAAPPEGPFRWIATAAVAGEDETFRFSSPGAAPDSRLVRSIAECGILTPLWVQPGSGETWRLVTGFRRYAAARRLGLPRLPVRVLPGTPEDCLRVALHESVEGRPLSPAEQVRVVAKFRRLAGYDDERLAGEILPLLGLPASRQVLRRLLQVGESPEYVLEAVEQGLTLEVAALLAPRPEAERRFLVDLVLRWRLGANKQRELVRLLDDLARLRRRPVEQLWTDLGLHELEVDREMSPADRFRRLRKRLQDLRLPVRRAHEARLRGLLAALDLPPGVEVVVPPDFEGDRLTVRLTAASPEALRALVKALEAVRDRDAWDELFELL